MSSTQISNEQAVRMPAAAPKHHWLEWNGAYLIAPECGRMSDEATQDATLSGERSQNRARA
jgi:hypothetical protein